jgi:hypothetical protein
VVYVTATSHEVANVSRQIENHRENGTNMICARRFCQNVIWIFLNKIIHPAEVDGMDLGSTRSKEMMIN